MRAVFPFVLFGSIGLFVLLGVIAAFTHRNLHDQIGQEGLLLGDDPFGGGSSGYDGANGHAGLGGHGGVGAADSMREVEIRQMLTARSQRLVSQGHAPLDIDTELARLQPQGAGGSHDSALAAEVRGLVLARNERRQRRGLEALDVEAEVQRTLAELDP
ncbi:MAG TPA: hypothetical protein VNY52_06995 [Solirubrobacteraceae bacterium]|jgi:hypothetical protein|nr:hypothetical protein [Solirubrobacteraceae bacterium]